MLVHQEMAAIETGYRIGRILVVREVLRQGAGGVLGRHQVLLHGARVARARVRARVLGTEATLWTDVTRGPTYTPGSTIMGGTSNIMRNILGERVLGLPREPH